MYTAADAFDSVLYGQPHVDTMNYITSQFSNIPTFINDSVRNLYNKAVEIAYKYNGDDIINFINRNNKLVTNDLRSANSIYVLSTLDEFKNATVLMQRYIMANPLIRKDYHAQTIDGYADTYVDMEPDSIGEDHYDYRRVHDGMMKENGTFTHYLDVLRAEDRHLTFEEKCSILDGHYWLEKLHRDKDSKTDLTQPY